MDRAYIDKHHLVDLYVQGRLSGPQLDEFEIFMLDHPEIVDEIEFAKGMQAELVISKDSLVSEQSGAESTFDTSSAAPPRNALLPTERPRGQNVALGIAAALFLSLLGNVIQFQASKEIGVDPLPQVTGLYDINVVRGSGTPPIEFEHGTGAAVFRLIFPELESLQIELESDVADHVPYSNTLAITDGFAILVIDLKELQPGTYTLRIRDVDPPVSRTIIVR